MSIRQVKRKGLSLFPAAQGISLARVEDRYLKTNTGVPPPFPAKKSAARRSPSPQLADEERPALAARRYNRTIQGSHGKGSSGEGPSGEGSSGQIGRAQILNKYWELANLDPEVTKGTITGQLKALDSLCEELALASAAQGAGASGQGKTETPAIYRSAWIRMAGRTEDGG